MGADDALQAPRYTTDLLKIPGMSFDFDVEDPRARIQKYIDAYRLSKQDAFQVRRTFEERSLLLDLHNAPTAYLS